MSGDFSKWSKLLPSAMTNPKRIEAFLCKEIEETLPADMVRPGVSNLRLQIFRESYRWAMMTLTEIADEVNRIKEETGQTVNVSDILKLKNNVLINWMDKIAPKLQAISHQVDVQLSINKITSSLMTIVLQFIPEEKRTEALTIIQKELTEIESVVDLEEIPYDSSKKRSKSVGCGETIESSVVPDNGNKIC
jgi:hypothetical protein